VTASCTMQGTRPCSSYIGSASIATTFASADHPVNF
jgi:hypothetical protein